MKMTSRIHAIWFPAIAGLMANGVSAQVLSTSELFERVNGSVCTIAAVDANDNLLRRGSGFVLEDSKLLVTNAHVLAGFETAEVKCGEQVTDVVRITNYDGEVDLVIAEIGAVDVPGLELSNASNISPGTQVYAFGSPYGLDGTITPGLTSAYRELEGRTYIQISTPISPGSSGGPVTDDRGRVIGVTVAALEVAQNINFAIPVSEVRDLPDVDLALSDVVSWGQQAPTPRQPSLPDQPGQMPAPTITTEAAFRGYAFGSLCGDIAFEEYERRLLPSTPRGRTKFPRTYGGDLVMDVELMGAPATAVYACSERYGLYGGQYRISGYPDVNSRLEGELTKEYGVGVPIPINEYEARERGCRFNFSLPGSRFYRPSERTTWDVTDRLQVELLICGGKSRTAFVFFADPTLADTVERTEPAPMFGDR